MENGLRGVNMSGPNPASTQAEQMQRYIIKNMTRNNIHTSAIQDAQIIQDRDYMLDSYRIIAAAAAQRAETGLVPGENH